MPFDRKSWKSFDLLAKIKKILKISTSLSFWEIGMSATDYKIRNNIFNWNIEINSKLFGREYLLWWYQMVMYAHDFRYFFRFVLYWRHMRVINFRLNFIASAWQNKNWERAIEFFYQEMNYFYFVNFIYFIIYIKINCCHSFEIHVYLYLLNWSCY